MSLRSFLQRGITHLLLTHLYKTIVSIKNERITVETLLKYIAKKNNTIWSSQICLFLIINWGTGSGSLELQAKDTKTKKKYVV